MPASQPARMVQRLNETTRGELPVLTTTELTEHPSPPDRDTQIGLLCRRQMMRAEPIAADCNRGSDTSRYALPGFARGYGPGGGVKIAWVPMRRQMTWACPAIRSWP